MIWTGPISWRISDRRLLLDGYYLQLKSENLLSKYMDVIFVGEEDSTAWLTARLKLPFVYINNYVTLVRRNESSV